MSSFKKYQNCKSLCHYFFCCYVSQLFTSSTTIGPWHGKAVWTSHPPTHHRAIQKFPPSLLNVTGCLRTIQLAAEIAFASQILSWFRPNLGFMTFKPFNSFLNNHSFNYFTNGLLCNLEAIHKIRHKVLTYFQTPPHPHHPLLKRNAKPKPRPLCALRNLWLTPFIRLEPGYERLVYPRDPGWIS